MPPLSKQEIRALRLLVAHGGARYGTQIEAMRLLKAKGCAYAHDRGEDGMRRYRSRMVGRWTWWPTRAGRDAHAALAAAAGPGGGPPSQAHAPRTAERPR